MARAEASWGGGWRWSIPQETICWKFSSILDFLSFECLLLEDFEEIMHKSIDVSLLMFKINSN